MNSEKEQREMECFGMTKTKVDEMMKNNFGCSKSLVAMSILSDVQDEVEFVGSIDNEKLRKTLNIVKYVISTIENKG